MENVSIRVGQNGAPNSISVGGGADPDDEEWLPDVAAPPPRRQSTFSLTMFITRAIGVIFPLVAIIIFVLTMGNMACSQGNAPAAFCRVLASVTEVAPQ